MRMRITDDQVAQVFQDLTARDVAVLGVRFEAGSTVTLITNEPTDPSGGGTCADARYGFERHRSGRTPGAGEQAL